MDSLPPEMVSEIFIRMDPKTVQRFRSSSRYLNGIFLNNQEVMPKVEYALYIGFTDEVVHLTQLDRKWPRVKLLINAAGPDDDSVDGFDLLDIVGRKRDVIVYETANLSSSMEKICSNMSLYCCLEILGDNCQKRFTDFYPCSLCMHRDQLMTTDEIGRRICRDCAGDEFLKRMHPFPTSMLYNCDFLRMKTTMTQTLPALWLTKDEIRRILVDDLPHLKYPFTPLRIKYSRKGCSKDTLSFVTELTGKGKQIVTQITGEPFIDENPRRVLFWWNANGFECVVILAYDEIIVLHFQHYIQMMET